ncbi:hypothetical protein ES703_99264 [subsurface metagenome]
MPLREGGGGIVIQDHQVLRRRPEYGFLSLPDTSQEDEMVHHGVLGPFHHLPDQRSIRGECAGKEGDPPATGQHVNLKLPPIVVNIGLFRKYHQFYPEAGGIQPSHHRRLE